MKIEPSKEDSDYMYNFVNKIINECGPRMPCSPAEAKAAEIIKTEMEKTCDNVSLEHFTCHPKAFLGWIKLIMICILSSIGLYLTTNRCRFTNLLPLNESIVGALTFYVSFHLF